MSDRIDFCGFIFHVYKALKRGWISLGNNLRADPHEHIKQDRFMTSTLRHIKDFKNLNSKRFS